MKQRLKAFLIENGVLYDFKTNATKNGDNPFDRLEKEWPLSVRDWIIKAFTWPENEKAKWANLHIKWNDFIDELWKEKNS